MPAPRHQFNDFDREVLRQALEAGLGLKLFGKSDCIRAADLLRGKHGYAPSATTLYSLLCGQLSGRSPYRATLDAISVALGFKDWMSLRRNVAPMDQRQVHRLDLGLALPELLAICMRQRSYAVVDEFLEEWSDRIEDESISYLGLAIYIMLQREPELERPFYERYAAHPVARKCFFEMKADPEFRLPHADEGLLLYAKASMPEEDALGYRDRMFAGSMLFRHHYLTSDPSLVEQGKQLYSEGIDMDAVSTTHLFPAARYLMYAVWYDLLQRRTSRRKKRESMLLDWAAERLREERTGLERDIIFHTMVEGFERVNLLDRVMPDILRLFPDVDPGLLRDPRLRSQLLANRSPNGIHHNLKQVTPPAHP